ncbi:hypothetical protein [Endozoicomonas acroporae]|uniref:hypothetical protein n=1 Tax=Endozoicomonas acroporae TaxID=1701104 RepID=UPI003D79DD62
MNNPILPSSASWQDFSSLPAPPMEENSKRSLLSKVGRAAGKAVVIPSRLASTVLNGGIFAAYYVTALAATGLASAGGTVFGMAKIAVDVASGKPHKSLHEYTITAGRETFNYLSRPYYRLPKRGSEAIFAGVAVLAVTILVFLIGGGGANIGPVHLDDNSDSTDYNPSGIKAALHPYRPSILLGRKIMEKTTGVLNRGKVID